jgi:hypothetical protein
MSNFSPFTKVVLVVGIPAIIALVLYNFVL